MCREVICTRVQRTMNVISRELYTREQLVQALGDRRKVHVPPSDCSLISCLVSINRKVRMSTYIITVVVLPVFAGVHWCNPRNSDIILGNSLQCCCVQTTPCTTKVAICEPGGSLLSNAIGINHVLYSPLCRFHDLR